jgi:hypothetical protein
VASGCGKARLSRGHDGARTAAPTRSTGLRGRCPRVRRRSRPPAPSGRRRRPVAAPRAEYNVAARRVHVGGDALPPFAHARLGGSSPTTFTRTLSACVSVAARSCAVRASTTEPWTPISQAAVHGRPPEATRIERAAYVPPRAGGGRPGRRRRHRSCLGAGAVPSGGGCAAAPYRRRPGAAARARVHQRRREGATERERRAGDCRTDHQTAEQATRLRAGPHPHHVAGNGARDACPRSEVTSVPSAPTAPTGSRRGADPDRVDAEDHVLVERRLCARDARRGELQGGAEREGHRGRQDAIGCHDAIMVTSAGLRGQPGTRSAATADASCAGDARSR